MIILFEEVKLKKTVSSELFQINTEANNHRMD